MIVSAEFTHIADTKTLGQALSERSNWNDPEFEAPGMDVVTDLIEYRSSGDDHFSQLVSRHLLLETGEPATSGTFWASVGETPVDAPDAAFMHWSEIVPWMRQRARACDYLYITPPNAGYPEVPVSETRTIIYPYPDPLPMSIGEVRSRAANGGAVGPGDIRAGARSGSTVERRGDYTYAMLDTVNVPTSVRFRLYSAAPAGVVGMAWIVIPDAPVSTDQYETLLPFDGVSWGDIYAFTGVSEDSLTWVVSLPDALPYTQDDADASPLVLTQLPPASYPWGAERPFTVTTGMDESANLIYWQDGRVAPGK